MIGKRTIGAALGALLALCGVFVVAEPANASALSGCVNIATLQFGGYKNLQGDWETPPTSHVSTTCNVYTWDVTIINHTCGGRVEVYITEPHSGPNNYWEDYTGYHVVYTCGQTHILMANLPVSTYFGIAIHQVSGGPDPYPYCGPGYLGCYVTMEW